MTGDRAEAARPRLSRDQALRALGWSLTAPVRASGGPLGFLAVVRNRYRPPRRAGRIGGSAGNVLQRHRLEQPGRIRAGQGSRGGNPGRLPVEPARRGPRRSPDLAARTGPPGRRPGHLPVPDRGQAARQQRPAAMARAGHRTPDPRGRQRHPAVLRPGPPRRPDDRPRPDPRSGCRAHPSPRPPAGGLWPRTRDA